MAYCKECGSYIADGLEDCPACGFNKNKKQQQTTEKKEQTQQKTTFSSGTATASDFATREREKESRESEQWKRYEQRKEKEREMEKGFREYESKQKEYTGHTYEKKVYEAEVVGNKKTGSEYLMAACAYLNWLILIPLLTKKDDEFVKFHLNQALVLLIAWHLSLLAGFVSGILMFIIGILEIRGIVGAITGKKPELPFIGEVKIIK